MAVWKTTRAQVKEFRYLVSLILSEGRYPQIVQVRESFNKKNNLLTSKTISLKVFLLNVISTFYIVTGFHYIGHTMNFTIKYECTSYNELHTVRSQAKHFGNGKNLLLFKVAST